jgi:hypothetical protein
MPSLNIELDYLDHPKTQRLVELLGAGAELLPIRLWIYAARFHFEDGRLSGYSVQKIEQISQWHGNPGDAVDALLRCGEPIGKAGYLEIIPGGYQLHDWKQHQGHIAAYKRRAKDAALKRWKQSSRNATSNATSRCYKQMLQADATSTCLDPALYSNAINRGIGGVGGKGDEFDPARYERMAAKLSQLFGRDPATAWACDEEHYLVEIARRPNAEAELEAICDFYLAARTSGEDIRLKEKIGSLLQDWQGQLDRAKGWRLHEQKLGQRGGRKGNPNNRNTGTANRPEDYADYGSDAV